MDVQHIRGPATRIERLEKRLKLMEQESKKDFDLSEYFVKPPDIPDDGVG